jgi:hypothetical protein
VPVAFATGVLIDGDHIFEYIDGLFRGWKKYMIVPLHAWEFSVLMGLALVVWYHPLFLAAVLGHLGHVSTDHIANNGKRFTYFITYRISKRFHQDRLVNPLPPWLRREEKPAWAWIEPWLWKMLVKRRVRRMKREQQRREGNPPGSATAA